MSILIKGMDKPTDCGLCPFEDFGYCNVKGERNTSESGIDADCPLIEVADRKTEPTISKMEQIDEPTTQTETQNSNLTFEKADEPQTERSE